jgi:aminoglycoside phosphotransferase (APT) family kinase protein
MIDPNSNRRDTGTSSRTLLEDAPVAVNEGSQIDAARLSRYLTSKIEGLSGELELFQFPSGHSNLSYMIKFGDRELVLKCAPPGKKAKSAHDMGREFHMLSKVSEAYPYAPKVFDYCEDETVLGSAFCVMERIRGIIIRRQYREDPRIASEQIGLQFAGLIEALARLHSIDVVAVGLGDFGRPSGYRQRQLDGWRKRLEGAATPNMAEFGAVITWLVAHIPQEPEGAAVIHNDFKMDNLVWNAANPAELIGVLDWEMATIGDPLMDLACTLSFWIEQSDPPELQAIRSMPSAHPAVFPRREAVARYEQLTGRRVSPIDFYLCFAFFRRAVIEQQKYARYLHGDTRDSRFSHLDADVRVLRDTCLNVIHRKRSS